MMHTMNTTGFDYNPGLLWGIHSLSVFAFAIGILFLVLWAIKELKPNQLKNWGIGLAVASTVAGLVTMGMLGTRWGFGGYTGNTKQMQMMEHMMEKMHEDGGMMHDSDDMMGMSMDDMAGMLKGKTGDAFDKAFIEGMIPHHQGAIDMARAALQSAKHDEIKRMARDIISAQQSEIDMMKRWMKEWGYTK